MSRLKLILNPSADHGHAADAGPNLRTVLEQEAEAASQQGGAAYKLTWVQTEYPRHAVELARQAAEEGFDAVVAVGGDGTVHEVVNGLMQVGAGERPRLGVIPVGSGNDFAHNLGLPDSPREAARCVLGDRITPVDVGLVVDGGGRREYWDNTIGIGFSGVVNIVTRRYTRLRGFMLYFVAVLETILFAPNALTASVSVNGDAPSKRALSMLSLCNGPREGGGFPVAPTAKMDDGLITYVVMRKLSRLNMLRLLPVVMSGKHLKHTRVFQSGTAEHIRIETDEAMAIHADGEVFGPWEANIRALEVSVIPSALEVLNACP